MHRRRLTLGLIVNTLLVQFREINSVKGRLVDKGKVDFGGVNNQQYFWFFNKGKSIKKEGEILMKNQQNYWLVIKKRLGNTVIVDTLKKWVWIIC